MHARRFTAPDLSLHALVREGRDPTVVLLHGAGGNALTWLPFLSALDDRRLVAFDLPGHGESAAVGDWRLEWLAPRIAALVERSFAGDVVWAGHSWGGKIAALVGALHPDRVAGLILVDPSPASPVPISPEAFVESAFAAELGPWSSIEAAVAAARGLPQYAAGEEALSVFRRGLVETAEGGVAARARREWLIAIATHALTEDHSPTIARIRRPTLLAIADRSLGWQEPTNVAALPNAKLVVLPGHHWLHWSHPEGLRAAAREFLAGLDR